ncbi:hypothetical protein QM327_23715 [Pantoea dispersa]|uniref:hypothetical protein n=1 Tax=Pantoea dispersa TaxID=59814 RepID=UPI0024B71ACE|nr:hypothetical protein [Pantoea dispersa]MDI9769545.1 hypothetical protein [Pantoea dispersa]
MKLFFSEEHTKMTISNYLKVIMRCEFIDEYTKKKSDFIIGVLNSMFTNHAQWDENTQFNIAFISGNLTSALDRDSEDILDDKEMNNVFILTFRFFSEFQLYQDYEAMGLYSEMKAFACDEIQGFSERQSEHINYILKDMPQSILKFLLSSQDFSTMRDFLKAKETAQFYKDLWDSELETKNHEVIRLKEALEEYKTGFNFVSLYDGFKELGQRKKSEIRWARAFMLLIGCSIPAVMAYSLYHFVNQTYAFASINELVIFLPASAITLVMLYYFRVSLANYNSTRAQLMQIELRMSLCQFIQGYSKYSSEISKENANLLGKFEDVIFSNIMTSEDKIPSTFDGLEQLATLIKAVKVK